MTAPRPDRTRGFSLVELLIALVFISLLMAGMLRVYGSAIQGFQASNESAKAQRDNRTALDSISDDLESAGFFFYYAGRPAVSGISVSSGSQNPLMLLPGQTVTNKTIADPLNPSSGTASETITYDELQFLRDDVLPISGQLA
ncbi:MAG TPA: prepilin-type N-terminal cleavage/methylation domain-containing protein, partial [Holophagaceae bacterium]|nr:prepilin-type N-terminal cleavage/methylation domain-containing protein [Holophagaceae bacterium]